MLTPTRQPYNQHHRFSIPTGSSRFQAGLPTLHASRPGFSKTPPIQFGASEIDPSNNPLEKKGTWKERLEDWRKQNFLQWRLSLEQHYNGFKKALVKALIGIAAVFSCFPIPEFMRNLIHRRVFFAPHKVSSSHLLQSDELRQKILKVGFHPEGKNTYELEGWYLQAKPGMPTVVYSHGRDCNISNLEHVLKALSQKGYGVFVYDYPGFGRSEGSPSEEALYEAGVAACKFLAGDQVAGLHVPYEQQILMGHSLGGAVAVDIAHKFSENAALEPEKRRFNREDKSELSGQPRALVLINTFTDLKEIIGELKQEFSPSLQKWFNENRLGLNFNSKEKIKSVTMPVLILHGDLDKTIKKHIGEQLNCCAEKSSHHRFELLPKTKHRLEDEACQQITEKLGTFLEGIPAS
jgi:alpha-beta hydrolase superfamily lysophospholipase